MGITDKVAIIGGSGFIGAMFLNFLQKNSIDCRGFSRSENPWRINAFDLNKFYEQTNDIKESLEGFNPNIIINAATHGAYSFEENIQEIYYSNIKLINKIIDWSRNKDVLIIHLGTSSEYGLNSNAPSENAKCIPNSEYAKAKLEVTEILSNSHAKLGQKSLILRLYSVYGPLEDPSRLVPTLVRKIKTNAQIEFANQNISRDFIYINDLNNLIMKVINFDKNKLSFEIFNIATGVKTTLEQVATIIKGYGKNPITYSYPKRKWDLENWLGNPTKANKFFDWKFETTFGEGLQKMINFYSLKNNEKYLDLRYSKVNNIYG